MLRTQFQLRTFQSWSLLHSTVTEVEDFEETMCTMETFEREDSVLKTEFTVQRLVFHHYIRTYGERAAVRYWLDPNPDEITEFRAKEFAHSDPITVDDEETFAHLTFAQEYDQDLFY